MTHARSSRLATGVLAISMLFAIAALVMVFGAWMGLWPPTVGFGLLRTYLNPMGYLVCGLAAVTLLYTSLRGDSLAFIKSAVACAIGLALLGPLINTAVSTPQRFPPIHDITTDTLNPPEFLVLDDSRPGARNTIEYGGPEVAAHQARSFPDIAPLRSDLTPDDAYARALEVGRDMGWQIVAEDPEALRFEASAHTPVLRFVDDIVVVVTPQETGSRVDLRSISRVGRSDRGVNAKRVRSFIEKFITS